MNALSENHSAGTEQGSKGSQGRRVSPSKARGEKALEMTKAFGSILGIPVALFALISVAFDRPLVAVGVAVVLALFASWLLFKTEWADGDQIVLAWLALAVVAIGVFVSWPRTLDITGVVVNASSTPVADIEVKLTDAHGGDYSRRTDEEGTFTFNSIPRGLSTIIAEGHQVEVDAKGSFVRRIHVNLTMHSGPISAPTGFHTLSLAGVKDATKSAIGPGPGTNHLRGIPFETGWTVRTQCADAPDSSDEISIDLDPEVSQPTDVHLLLHAGWATNEFLDQETGFVRLRFSNRTHETPLVVGDNIRDWYLCNCRDGVFSITSLDVQQAWQGLSLQGNGDPGVIDLLTLHIPERLRDSGLTQIEIIDTSRDTTRSLNPCVHVFAVTVEYLEAP